MTTRRGFIARMAAALAATKLLQLPEAEVVKPVITPIPRPRYLYRPEQTILVQAGEKVYANELVKAAVDAEGNCVVTKADPGTDNVLGVALENIPEGWHGMVRISTNIFKYDA